MTRTVPLLFSAPHCPRYEMSPLSAIAEDAPSNDSRSAPPPTLKHAVSKGSIQEILQHVDPRRRSRSLSDEYIQKTYEERYATKAKGD